MSTEQSTPEVGGTTPTPESKEMTVGEVFSSDNVKTGLKVLGVLFVGFLAGRHWKKRR